MQLMAMFLSVKMIATAYIFSVADFALHVYTSRTHTTSSLKRVECSSKYYVCAKFMQSAFDCDRTFYLTCAQWSVTTV